MARQWFFGQTLYNETTTTDYFYGSQIDQSVQNTLATLAPVAIASTVVVAAPGISTGASIARNPNARQWFYGGMQYDEETATDYFYGTQIDQSVAPISNSIAPNSIASTVAGTPFVSNNLIAPVAIASTVAGTPFVLDASNPVLPNPIVGTVPGTPTVTFWADKFVGTSGTALIGNTASDGRNTYSGQAGFLYDGNGGVYVNSSQLYSYLFASNIAPAPNFDFNFDFVVQSAWASGGTNYLGVLAHGITADGQSTQGFKFRISYTTSGVTTYWFDEQIWGQGAISQTGSLANLALNSTRSMILKFRGTTIELWDSGTKVITYNRKYAGLGRLGNFGLIGYSNGTVLASSGVHIGNVKIVPSSGTPTKLTLLPPVRPWATTTGGTKPIQDPLVFSGYPVGIHNIVGNQSMSDAQLYKDVNHMVVGFGDGGTFPTDTVVTLSEGTFTGDSQNIVGGNLIIPAGSAAAPFMWICPQGKAAGNFTLTASAPGLTGGGLTLTAAAHRIYISGDSESDRSFSSTWPNALVDILGPNWSVWSEAVSASTTADVAVRAPVTVWPYYDNLCPYKQYVILWIGTNNLNANLAATDIPTKIQALVNSFRSSGWPAQSIFVMGIASRSEPDPTTWMANAINNTNTPLEALYGPGGTDPNAIFIKWYNGATPDPYLLTPTGYTNQPPYNVDGIHLGTTLGGTIIAGYTAPYILGQALTITPTAIGTTVLVAAVGLSASLGSGTISPTAIGTTVLVGLPRLVAGVTLAPLVVGPTSQAGVPALGQATSVAPTAIGTTLVVGLPRLVAGVTIPLLAVGKTTAVGLPRLLALDTISFTLVAIGSTAQAGVPALITGDTIAPLVVDPTAVVGIPRALDTTHTTSATHLTATIYRLGPDPASKITPQ